MCDNVPNGLVLDVTGWKETTVEVDKKFCSFEAKIQVVLSLSLSLSLSLFR